MADSVPFLSQANLLGHGVNVYGRTDPENLLRPALSFDRADTKVVKFVGADWAIPVCVTAIGGSSGTVFEVIAETRQGYQQELSAHMGVGAEVPTSAGCFTGEFNFTFAQEAKRSDEYTYSNRTGYFPLMVLELTGGAEYATPEFKARVDALPGAVDAGQLDLFTAFFNDFGAFFVSKVVLGGYYAVVASVATSSELSKDDIGAGFKAGYQGVTASGGFDRKNDWDKYRSAASVRTYGRGGAAGGALENLLAADPLNPKASDPETYRAWTKAIQDEPGIADFKVDGIWRLCGGKQAVVREAWTQFAGIMNPRLVVETSARILTRPVSPGQIVPPFVSLNGAELKPGAPPTGPSGFQVVVFKAGGDLTDPGTVQMNEYVCFPEHWLFNLDGTYDALAARLEGRLDQAGNILLMASFGLDGNMSPNTRFLRLLQAAGAGSAVNGWAANTDRGSGSDQYVVGNPADVVFVGRFGMETDAACELVDFRAVGQVSSTVRVVFYREAYGGTYDLTPGVS